MTDEVEVDVEAAAGGVEVARVEVPRVGRPPKLKAPKVQERLLGNGLRALVVRRTGVPRFELRLRIPVARRRDEANLARQRLLAATVVAGTPSLDAVAIQQRLQALGASLDVAADVEEVVVSASALTPSLRPVVELVTEVLTAATFPSEEVELERARAGQELTMARSQPEVIAQQALQERLYPGHPYAHVVADEAELDAVTPASLRRYARQRLAPQGAACVLVGDVRPGQALDALESALARWDGAGRAGGLAAPAPASTGPTLLVDRPGAVQTNIRLGVRTIGRLDAGYPALLVANTIFGGYFSSRLVQNIREDKGYTYSPRSGVSSNLAASHLQVAADVATDVTAAALLEIRYELGRMVVAAVGADELLAAKRYLQGMLALSVQTQAGLASHLARLVAFGLDAGDISDLPAAIESVDAGGVLGAARRFLSPTGMVTVLVGDAARVGPQLEPLEEVAPA